MEFQMIQFCLVILVSNHHLIPFPIRRWVQVTREGWVQAAPGPGDPARALGARGVRGACGALRAPPALTSTGRKYITSSSMTPSLWIMN